MAGLVNTLGGEGAVAAASNAGDAAAPGRFRDLPFFRAWGQSGIYHGMGRRQFCHWRPSANQLMNNCEYRIYFQVEGDDKQYCLFQTDDAGNSVLAEDAKRLLGMTTGTIRGVAGS